MTNSALSQLQPYLLDQLANLMSKWIIPHTNKLETKTDYTLYSNTQSDDLSLHIKTSTQYCLYKSNCLTWVSKLTLLKFKY